MVAWWCSSPARRSTTSTGCSTPATAGIPWRTLIVLDEVQQFIGDSGDRAYSIQEVVESCCKHSGGRLLFVGTGQTAMSGTISQLRNQLRIVHEAACATAEQTLGQVVPRDFIDDQLNTKLLQHGLLSREVYDRIASSRPAATTSCSRPGCSSSPT